MKKTLAIIPALALAFAFSTSFAFASESCENDCPEKSPKCCPSVEINNKSEAKVLNNITSSSNSGYNKIISGFEKMKTKCSQKNARATSAEIFSGDTKSASYAETHANDTKIVIAAPKSAKVEVNNLSEATVTNNVTSSSNSGYNYISLKKGDAVIGTGYANSGSEAFTMVNTNVIEVK